MQGIDNIESISDYLDTTNVTESDHIYRLLGCADISLTQVCTLTAGSVTIDDSDLYEQVVDDLVANNIIVAKQDLNDMLELYSGTDTHRLRQGELFKVALYFSLHASSQVVPIGYPAAGIVTEGIPIRAESAGMGAKVGTVFLMYDSQGRYLTLDGYSTPNQLLGGRGSAEVPFLGYGSYKLVEHEFITIGTITPITSSRTRFYWNAFYVDRATGKLTPAHTWLDRQIDLTSTDGPVEVAYSITPTPGDASKQRLLLKFTWTSARTGSEMTKTEYFDIAICNFDRLWLPYDFHFNGVTATSGNITYRNGLGEGHLYTPILYYPSVKYDVDEFTDGVYTVDGTMTCIFAGDLFADATMTATGYYQSSSVYLIDKDFDPYPYAGTPQILVPTYIDSAAPVYLQPTYRSNGDFTLTPGSLSPGTVSYGPTYGIEPDAEQIMLDALATYDRISVFEYYDDVTTEMVNAALGGGPVTTDSYLEGLMDHTAMLMCDDQISAIKQFMMSDDGDLAIKWEVNYFTDASLLAGQAVKVYPWTRVRFDDDDAYYPVTDCEASDAVYVDGILVAQRDLSVHAENFVYQNKSLDEWWQTRESADELYRALEEAHNETSTQILLYQCLNGVMNSLDWVNDISTALVNAVNQAKDFMSEVLQLTAPYQTLTTAQREALLGSVAKVSVPATRVADMVSTAVNLGATSAQQVMDILSACVIDINGFSMVQVREQSARDILDMIIAISGYKKWRLNCTTAKHAQDSSTNYVLSFASRMSSAIVHAGGVDTEFVDIGPGAYALYPALHIGTVYLPDPNLTDGQTVVLPLEHSLVVIYPGVIEGEYTVGWYARHYGGSDYDALESIVASLKELEKFINSFSDEFSIQYYRPAVEDVSYTGDADLVGKLNYATCSVAGALAGFGFGAAFGPWGMLAGSLGGISLGLKAARLSENTLSSTNAGENLDYRLDKLDGMAGTLVMNGQTVTDPNTIAQLIASLMMACVHHGAFQPLGNDVTLRTQRYALFSPGNPYFKYVYVGPREDYTPFIITGVGILTAASTGTMIKAFANPTRNPTFLPIMLGSAAYNGAEAVMNKVAAAVAAKNDPTLQMQKDILAAVSEIEAPGQTGTYTDSQGTVTLRMIVDISELIDGKLSALSQQLSTTGATVLPY